jgi:serine/threonine-protein kinase
MSPQASIAHYRITAKLGEGGMGEVWRATDTKLGRDVAIKMLPDVFANDSDRLARFRREAQVLASLNHPNIAAIYGVEERALVMELVEGPNLAERIAQGAMQCKEALPILDQLVDALEYAHERGIVHRDLKPANVKITPHGRVKVLDFGLAKAVTPDAAPANPVSSPTLTMRASVVGTLLGTAAYMAPEQARGHAVDKRADIWAFGVVVYEMVTGRRLFDGPTVSDTLAAVLSKEPDWERVPVKLLRLLQLCLKKDARERLRDIGDARALIAETVEARPRQQNILPWILSAALAAACGGLLWQTTRPTDQPPTHLDLDLGPDALTGFNLSVAISPDGRRLVYPVRGPDGKQHLATRLLDQARATLLPSTLGARDPFFSPDGQSIGFYANSQLKKTPVVGGAAMSLGSALNSMQGGSWGDDGNIVAALASVNPLSRISAAGGAGRLVTKLAPSESTHRWPQVLPGGRGFLFTASASVIGMENAQIQAFSAKISQTKTVLQGGYFGRYLPTGHLVYVHQGLLFGVAFNLDALEVRGTPVPLLDDLAANSVTGGGQFDFSSGPSGHGTLVYEAGKDSTQTWQISWLDSLGKIQPLIAAPGTYSLPRLSPDGRKLAFIEGGDIHVYDLQRETPTRATFSGAVRAPVWAPDSRHIAYSTTSGIVWIRSDGVGEPQQLLKTAGYSTPWSFTPDGGRLAYFERGGDTGFDLWTVVLDLTDPDHPKPGIPESFLRTPKDESVPKFSPDARWIAYRSNESGNSEIYVRPFPNANGGKWQISNGGGVYPFWSNTSRQLFYQTPDGEIMEMDYTIDGASFVPGRVKVWSDKQLFSSGTSSLDLAPDGKRFVVFTMTEAAEGGKRGGHIVMLQNFFDEVKRRIPVR